MDDKQHIVETIKHIGRDLDEACRVDSLLRALDDSPIVTNWDTIEQDIRDPLALIEASLVTNLVLSLARMHDGGRSQSKRFNDRMCIDGIFGRLESCPDLKGAFFQTEAQETEYSQALKKWNARHQVSSIRGLVETVNAAISGTSSHEIAGISEGYRLPKLLTKLRDNFLAHNLNHLDTHGMRHDELQSILTLTIDIVEPLERALGSTGVGHSNTRDIWRQKAAAFWGRLSE